MQRKNSNGKIKQIRIYEIVTIKNLKHSWQFILLLLDEVTDRAITLMCKLMKMQAFNDENKRTEMIIAYYELIKFGKGIISISEENKEEFGTKLIKYYQKEIYE